MTMPSHGTTIRDTRRTQPRSSIEGAIEIFRANGGLMTGDDLAQVLFRAEGCSQPTSRLARLIVERSVLSFERHGVHLLPMAQFAAPLPALKTSVRSVLNELRTVFDELELAIWFAEPNCWLDGARPIACVDAAGTALHHAALADRFVAAGP